MWSERVVKASQRKGSWWWTTERQGPAAFRPTGQIQGQNMHEQQSQQNNFNSTSRHRASEAEIERRERRREASVQPVAGLPARGRRGRVEAQRDAEWLRWIGRFRFVTV